VSSLEKVAPFLEYDKLVHFGAYAGLAFLSLLAFEGRRGMAVALSMIFLGAGIEILQHFSPGRTPDIDDAIANTLGVLSGIALGTARAGSVRLRRRKTPLSTAIK
jgi:VanZ family protein